MMPCKKQTKKDDDNDDQKNSKKGKSVKPGGTMGRGQPEEDSDDPDLDIDNAMLMKTKPLKNRKLTKPAKNMGGARGLFPKGHLKP